MSVDIERTVSTFKGVEPFPGLAKAWKWSPTVRFTFALAMNQSGNGAFQLNCLDSFDADLVRSVLEFSRAHRLDAESAGAPLAAVPGFRWEPYSFDVVACASSAVHGYHAGRNDSLNDAVVAVFPAFTCEFSGTETVEEALSRFKRMLHPSVMSRAPAPYLRMRYENTKTGGGSIGPLRGFTTPDVLLRELRLLEEAPRSFVEFENFKGDVWRVEWQQGRWFVDGSSIAVTTIEDLNAWVSVALGCP
jgi:hypothetical protein